MESEAKLWISFWTILILLVMVVGSGALWGCPRYIVYQQELAGKAELARAESNRQIAVREAQAKMDAAKLLADAEIARARGVAEANRIIGEGLKGHDEYLRYLWISNIDKVSGQIIYVPTEASLPILEATRSGASK